MHKAKPKHRQSLLDIAIQESGELEAVMEIAALNDVSITDSPDTDTELKIPNARNSKVVQTYQAKGVQPATDISGDEEELAPFGGIGYMGIEIDFVVS